MSRGTSPQHTVNSQAVVVWDVAFLGAEEQLEALTQAGVLPANPSAPSWDAVAWVCGAGRAGAAFACAGAPLQQGSMKQVTSVSWWCRCPVLGE